MHLHKYFTGVVIGLLLFLGIEQSQAQIFRPGLKVGLTTSNLVTEGIPTTGLTTGFIAEHKLTNWFLIRHEYNLLWHGTDKHAWERDDIDYFAFGLPVMVEFMPIQNLYLGTGMELDFLTHTRGAAMPNNRFNLGLLAHIEYRIANQLGLGLRYVHNLGNFSDIRQIGEVAYDPNEPSLAFPGSSFQATLSYHFCR
ncbi:MULTISPECIES: outer membrane beta-barrel protein [unclassified Aureispira]|uniref:outer membrane beta-barrel protein n=1 Tax=unclassified Aureispira TaxID=2649989 RepID=UPI0018CC1BEA|nr:MULTISPECIES: outer membrane beta-barrel protein [unclassified Aureispira]WMX17528.1 outer membrane beta-barrel protein [Aureispira sp. CCB-E]